jgi:hypothetical protein
MKHLGAGNFLPIERAAQFGSHWNQQQPACESGPTPAEKKWSKIFTGSAF